MGEVLRQFPQPVDVRRPSGQLLVLGVRGPKVVDVPQQVCPAALLGARVMIVGGVEVTDQHSAEGLAQRLVHHLLVPAPPQEVPLGGEW